MTSLISTRIHLKTATSTCHPGLVTVDSPPSTTTFASVTVFSPGLLGAILTTQVTNPVQGDGLTTDATGTWHYPEACPY